MGGVKLIIK